MSEKKIIGYKLKSKFEELRKAALLVSETIGNWENSSAKFDISINQSKYINRLTNAGVLDLWFEPVYKSEYPDIVINGYKGEFFDYHVKFGCAEISKQIFLDLYAIRTSDHEGVKNIESVTIGKGTFTKAQIKEIAEYFLNK